MRVKLNENFVKLSENYLFSEIARRIDKVRSEGGERIISLGIGDVTLPLAKSVADAMARSVENLKTREGFCGYGDTRGNIALREALCKRYEKRGVLLSSDEIFINDGAKSDLGNMNDLFGESEALIIAPAYPVYLDASVMSGRKIQLLEANRENEFLPLPKSLSERPMIIYLCSPSNPTGAVFDRKTLACWVEYAQKSGSVIIFDGAYEAFIADAELPHSIFEIEGARECAIEVCSFSKMAGFTGVRCGWTVIAKENPLHKLWVRRQAAKFNGASCISQAGALAVLDDCGARECATNIAYYMENARLLADFLTKKGLYFTGGVHAPYLWVECPQGESSWQFFDRLLHSAHLVCTPGAGFGRSGEGFVRLSSFGSREDIYEALTRLDRVM